jgi:hypothetical protein
MTMATTGGISVCSGELAIEGQAGVVFIRPQKGALTKEDQLGVTARFDTGEFFVMDGFLNEWKEETFSEVGPGARLAASFDGVKIRLAGVVNGIAKGRFTGEDLRLRCAFQGLGFLRGVAMPGCGSDVRLGDISANGDGFQYTVAADGAVRFEAEMPMSLLYHSRKRIGREFHLENPPPYRMRLDLQDPGVPGGVLASLGGSSPDLRPYEMLWFRPEPIKDQQAFISRFFEGGQWVMGNCEAKWYAGLGFYFLFQPKDKKLIWTVHRRVPRRAWLDFGTLRSIHDADFKMRIFAKGRQIAEKEVKKGLAGEPFKVSLAQFAGESVPLRVEFESNRKDWPIVILQQIRVTK